MVDGEKAEEDKGGMARPKPRRGGAGVGRKKHGRIYLGEAEVGGGVRDERVDEGRGRLPLRLRWLLLCLPRLLQLWRRLWRRGGGGGRHVRGHAGRARERHAHGGAVGHGAPCHVRVQVVGARPCVHWCAG